MLQAVTIQTGQNTPLSVTVKPLDGYGTLNLTVTWNPAAVGIPNISAQLVPATGSTLSLNFSSTTPGTGTYSSSTIPTGYYTLVLQLQDNGVLVMGAVEVVRIVKGQVTSGSFDFQQAAGAGGPVTVSVTPEADSPLAVSLSGQVAQLPQGSTMTVAASVPPGSGAVVYAWYVNGASKTVGQSLTFGSGLELGHHRLDVTAFTSTGGKAGSASHDFLVIVPPMTQVVLQWDPNTETDLAGYKIHWGTRSGVYTSTVDVGNETSCTLTGLLYGKTYYITATAYNAEGLQSAYSNEVVFTGS